MNRGFKCRDCGQVCEKAKEKTISKVKYKVCPHCSGLVDPWERPLNERPGRCINCAGGKFNLAMVKGRMLRNCPGCGMVIDVDTKEVIREGNKEHEYKPNK